LTSTLSEEVGDIGVGVAATAVGETGVGVDGIAVAVGGRGVVVGATGDAAQADSSVQTNRTPKAVSKRFLGVMTRLLTYGMSYTELLPMCDRRQVYVLATGLIGVIVPSDVSITSAASRQVIWVYSELVDRRPFGFPLSATNRRKHSRLVDHESPLAQGKPKGLNPF